MSDQVVSESRTRPKDGEEPPAQGGICGQRGIKPSEHVAALGGLTQPQEGNERKVGVRRRCEFAKKLVCYRESTGGEFSQQGGTAVGIGKAEPGQRPGSGRQPLQLLGHRRYNTRRYRSRSYSVTWRR